MTSLQQINKSLLLEQLDNSLPQTQCTQCGFEGCLPYAQAMLDGKTEINRCPPGGDKTIQKLAILLNTPVKSLNPECGETTERHIASIDPKHCIGCTLCIKACPVDAIIGSSKRRHAVIADLCTGCELCIAPCPVDCIDMVFLPEHAQWETDQALLAKQRMLERQTRLVRQNNEQHERLETKAIHKVNELPQEETDKRTAIIQAALARAKARRAEKTSAHE